jgi:hypothetical protein
MALPGNAKQLPVYPLRCQAQRAQAASTAAAPQLLRAEHAGLQQLLGHTCAQLPLAALATQSTDGSHCCAILTAAKSINSFLVFPDIPAVGAAAAHCPQQAAATVALHVAATVAALSLLQQRPHQRSCCCSLYCCCCQLAESHSLTASQQSLVLWVLIHLPSRCCCCCCCCCCCRSTGCCCSSCCYCCTWIQCCTASQPHSSPWRLRSPYTSLTTTAAAAGLQRLTSRSHS